MRTLALLSAPLLLAIGCSSPQWNPPPSDGGSSGDDAGASGGQTGASGGQTGASGGQTGASGGQTGNDPLTGIDTSVDSASLEWRWANATNYTSYPDPGSEECVVYNGCTWAGYFAAVNGKQTEEWVANHNIIAMFSAGDDNAAFQTYKLKTIRLRKGGREMDVTVYDTCGDSDCDGCCTTNATRNGYTTLIDLESYTYARFGQGDGPIEWACVDCQ